MWSRFRVRGAKSVVLKDLNSFLCRRLGSQCEIDEACARDGRGLANIASIKMRDDFLRNGARILAALLPQNQRRVRLVIAEPGIGRGAQLAGLWQAGTRERVAQ